MAAIGGRGSRARTKARRAKERRARKAAKQTQYEAWRDAGTNQKSKRFRKHNKMAAKTKPARELMLVPKAIGLAELVRRKVHGGSENCGNIGCRKCSSVWRVKAA